MSNSQPVTVSCVADRNFVTILKSYKNLKQIKKLTLVCVLILSMVPFAWGISTLAVFLTLVLCLARDGILRERREHARGRILADCGRICGSLGNKSIGSNKKCGRNISNDL